MTFFLFCKTSSILLKVKQYNKSIKSLWIDGNNHDKYLFSPREMKQRKAVEISSFCSGKYRLTQIF